MTELYRNKYRIASTRMQNWNYGSEGLYFITICTKNREHFFGEIREHEMLLSELGNVVQTEWEKMPEIRPDMNLELGAFQVMPNHFHGIIGIGSNKYNSRGGLGYGDAMHCGYTIQNNEPSDYVNKFGPQSKNIGSILRGFKSAVTTSARINGIPFSWQERFHDHIIRSEEEFVRISQYIRNNPANWKEDRFYQTKK